MPSLFIPPKKPEVLIGQDACENCIYGAPTNDPNIIQCHRYPPQINVSFGFDKKTKQVVPEGKNTAWPETRPHAWCGEHKRKSNLITEMEN